FAPTFFPGTASPSDAQRLTVVAGREINDLVMVLRPSKAARVTGTVTDADGKPLTPSAVMVMRNSGMNVDIAGNGTVRPDGTFTVNALAPGRCARNVYSPGASALTVNVPSGRTVPFPAMSTFMPLLRITITADGVSGLPSASVTVPVTRAAFDGRRTITRSLISRPATTVRRCASLGLAVSGKNVGAKVRRAAGPRAAPAAATFRHVACR